MKKTEITKGDWNLCEYFHAEGEKWMCVLDGAIDVTHNVDGNIVATQKYSTIPQEERIANAKAISAVPEMIEALILTHEVLLLALIWGWGNSKKDRLDDFEKAKTAIESALTKAGATDV